MDENGIAGIGEQIERLVQSAQSSEVLSAPEPSGYYYLVGPDGKAFLIQAKPAWHAEKLATPTEAAKFIADIKTATNPAIFYDENAVRFVYDLNDRRHGASVALVPSEQLKNLKAISGVAKSQRDFIRLLRVVFRGCLPDNSLLARLRNVKWKLNADSGANLQHGKESIGRAIEQQVMGEDTIPEEISLTIPVFENHKFRTTVSCAVEVFTDNQTFSLTPFPLELHNAMELTLDNIFSVFSAEGMPPAFRGQP